MSHPSSSLLPAVKPTNVRYVVLGAACLLAVLTYIQRLGFVNGLPEIKQDLGLNDTQTSDLAAAFLVAYGLFQVPGGLLGDRLGGRHLLTLLVLGWSVLTGLVALTATLPASWSPFVLLLGLRFLFGLFQAGGFPALARVLADWMPVQQRGFAQGLVWTFSRLGGFLAPFLFLWLLGGFGSRWAPAFWALGGLGLVWCAAFWPWFRNRPEEMGQVNAAERDLIGGWQVADRRLQHSEQPPIRQPQPAIFPAFLRSRNVWALCLMYGLVGFSGNFITNLLPVYLKDHRSLDGQTRATLAGLPLAFGIVSCLLGGFLSDLIIRRWGSRTWGRRLVGCLSLALAALCSLAVPWVHNVVSLALAISAWFFFNDATMGPAWASCADVGERYAGTLSGAMNMTGAFAGAAGMRFAGMLFDAGRHETVFIVFACSYVLAALCWLAVDVTKPLLPASPEAPEEAKRN
jgi:sugar phosphate permease